VEAGGVRIEVLLLESGFVWGERDVTGVAAAATGACVAQRRRLPGQHIATIISSDCVARRGRLFQRTQKRTRLLVCDTHTKHKNNGTHTRTKALKSMEMCDKLTMLLDGA